MSDMKLTVDEFVGRGVEDIANPVELVCVFNTVLAAIPKRIPDERILSMFVAVLGEEE